MYEMKVTESDAFQGMAACHKCRRGRNAGNVRITIGYGSVNKSGQVREEASVSETRGWADAGFAVGAPR